jgi:hypothetical protein
MPPPTGLDDNQRIIMKKHDIEYLLGALRTVAAEAKKRQITDLYAVAQAGLDLYEKGPKQAAAERGDGAVR